MVERRPCNPFLKKWRDKGLKKGGGFGFDPRRVHSTFCYSTLWKTKPALKKKLKEKIKIKNYVHNCPTQSRWCGSITVYRVKGGFI